MQRERSFVLHRGVLITSAAQGVRILFRFSVCGGLYLFLCLGGIHPMLYYTPLCLSQCSGRRVNVAFAGPVWSSEELRGDVLPSHECGDAQA